MFALELEGNVLRWCRVGGPYRPVGQPAIGGQWGVPEKGKWMPIFGIFGSGR